jgi:hypothetical protein
MSRKEPERSPLLTQVAKHRYRPDGVPDHRGEERCDDCGLGRGHPLHEPVEVDPETAEVGRRITGEREVPDGS